jgi:DNA repair exonuclease SbcCD ATPase subunit
MSTVIKEILSLINRIDKEATLHLETKLKLTTQIKESTEKEKNLLKEFAEFENAIKKSKAIKPKDKKSSKEISSLISTITDLEQEIIRNEISLKDLETELTRKKTELGILINKIEMMNSEKEDLISLAKESKLEQSRMKKTSMKVKNEQEKLAKIRKQIERQEEIKKNLEAYFFTLSLFERIIEQSSGLADEESEPINVPQEIQELIIKAKNHFNEAETKFSANNLTPFLLETNNAYQDGIKAFILLCDRIPDDLVNDSFNEQIINLVDHGFMLNTRHLEAVGAMLQKLEKGVEIAPLASFANEVHHYFTENLSLLRLIPKSTKF